MAPSFEDRWQNSLPDYVTFTPVDGDPFERAAQRVRAPYEKSNQRESGLPQVLDYYGNKIKSALTAPQDAYTGQMQVSDPETGMPTQEAMGRAGDVAGLTGIGSPFAVKGALGSAGGKLMQMENKSAAPPFYSALEHAVENTKQQKMPADQWLGTISNSKGVKPEELDWTGFKDFLAEKGKQPVTKAEVQEHLNNNKVELKEVNKGNIINSYSHRTPEEWQGAIDHAESNQNWNEVDRLNHAWEEQQGVGQPGSTKYSQYQLPGGENYREMLMTMPEKKSQAVENFNKFKQELELKHNTHIDSAYDAEKITGDKSIGDKYQDLLYDAQKDQSDKGINYKSSHWDEPNILAHVRMNDRNIEGKKSLHLEEIQSDWHQQGREKGYVGQPDPTRYGYNISRDEGVPDAPFKKSWHELALKRMVREAAEKGYDRLSWTPGEAQAARYDLSKQVDEIHYNPETHRLVAKKDGNHVVNENSVPPEKLPDYIGKEAAKKIMDQEPNVNGLRSLKNQELRIGGEGMKGFYDQIIPKAIEKIGKEHGVKVKTGPVEGGDGSWSLVNKYNHFSRGGATKEEAEQSLTKKIKEWGNNDNWKVIDNRHKVHYIDIPESLKNVATQKGFPLFSSGLPITFTPVDGDPHKSANTVGDAIDTAAKKYGINPTVLKGIASIESSWDPGSNRNKATQYKGLFQIGKEEWKQHGNGDIYNAKDNANAAAKMLSEHAQWFKDNYGRDPTPGEFYMMHQQGRGFISHGTMTNVGGNPYPGMRGPQTPETFKQGWSDTLARKMAQFGGADSISDGTERPSSNTKVASNSPTPTHKFTPVDFNPFDLVNHANHVPYGAGASDTPSGYPVNIDKRIPQHNDELKLPDGKPADLHKYLTIHEIEEYKAMKNGTPYHTAHHDIATPMEKKAVESDGVDWKKYTHIMDGYLKKTEEEGYKDLPKGLYAKPYHSRSLIKPEPKTENGKQNA